MRSRPLTVVQLEDGERWLDRIRQRVFDADPTQGEDPDVFLAFCLLGACHDVVRAEQAVAHHVETWARQPEPVVILDYGSGV